LLHAAGEPACRPVAKTVQIKCIQVAVCPLPVVGLGDFPKARSIAEILLHGQIWIERESLCQIADSALESDLSGGGPHYPGEHLETSSLTRSVGSDQAEDLPFANFEGNAVQGEGSAVLRLMAWSDRGP